MRFWVFDFFFPCFSLTFSFFHYQRSCLVSVSERSAASEFCSVVRVTFASQCVAFLSERVVMPFLCRRYHTCAAACFFPLAFEMMRPCAHFPVCLPVIKHDTHPVHNPRFL